MLHGFRLLVPLALSTRFLGALCVSATSAILLLLFASHFLASGLFPISEPATDPKTASINLELVVLPSVPEQKSGVVQKTDQVSSNVSVGSQLAMPTTTPPAPNTDRTESVNKSARKLDWDAIEFFLQQGNRFIQVGDLAAARVVFERAAESGSATAALAMGATYDPIVLAKLGAVGMGANVERAQSWYEKAKALGSAEALPWLASSDARATASLKDLRR